MAVAQPRPGLGKALVAGALIWFAIIFTIITAALLIAGSHPLTAIGVAAFVGSFGGPGFGTMFGANWYVSRAGEPE